MAGYSMFFWTEFLNFLEANMIRNFSSWHGIFTIFFHKVHRHFLSFPARSWSSECSLRSRSYSFESLSDCIFIIITSFCALERAREHWIELKNLEFEIISNLWESCKENSFVAFIWYCILSVQAQLFSWTIWDQITDFMPLSP